MSGAMMLAAGSGGGRVLTVVTKTAAGRFDDGFADGSSFESTQGTPFGAYGSLSDVTWAGLAAQVNALFYTSATGHVSPGTVNVEVQGNQSLGYVNNVIINGVAIPMASRAFHVGTGTTTFTSATGLTNPFGTTGTKSVVIN